MTSFLLSKLRARGVRNSGLLVRVVLATLLAGSAFAAVTGLSHAQLVEERSSTGERQLRPRDPDAQLFLKADQLVYDNDAETVTASGNVQLDYDGYNVVARQVTYNQQTRKVKAFGNVEIREPDGNIVFAQEIDLTDDFSEGFVNALRVETPERTTFAAESAQRFAGDKTVFNNGVYTACKTCKKSNVGPPLWQIKARKVTSDGVEKTIAYEDATFELFGKPIAYLPYFKHADPSVKRKSGFLIGRAGYTEELGLWYRQPYFLVTGDSHDLTFTVGAFSRQGFLGQVEWRHQLENGFYTLQAAGINQQDPDSFSFAPSNSVSDRGMFATTGLFNINPRWTFGWNYLAQSDESFSRDYEIDGYTSQNITNEVFLRGLNKRSFFDLSAYQYLIQPSLITSRSDAFQDEDQQAIIRPLLDYNYEKNSPYTGGQFNLDVNVTSLQRDEANVVNTLSGDNRTHGLEGETTRASVDASWKKTLTTSGGLSITPSASLRADWVTTNGTGLATQIDAPGFSVDDGSQFRFMPTAGLEISYPILARTATSSHVFEPVANVFVRPDLGFDGVLPNEDAQSLVFDTTTLFERDKFSGYDRIEEGIRANVGLRYSGIFAGGLALNALIGQSYHLAGENSFSRLDDLVNTGEESGLESDVSDYVASFGAITPNGLTFNVKGRFDEDTFDLRRGEAALAFRYGNISTVANYTFIDGQPDTGFADDREQVGGTVSYSFSPGWSAFAAYQYDVQDSFLLSQSYGLTYSCDCFNFALVYSETNANNGQTTRTAQFRITLRTLGEFDGDIDIGSNDEGSVF